MEAGTILAMLADGDVLGARLCTLRDAPASHAAFAHEAGLPEARLSGILTGEARPTLEEKDQIAAVIMRPEYGLHLVIGQED